MWGFMQRVNAKRGLKLEVCRSFLQLRAVSGVNAGLSEGLFGLEPRGNAVHAKTSTYRHSANYMSGASGLSALISGKTCGKAVD